MRSFTWRILALVISVILLGTTGAMLPGCTARRVIVVKSQQKPAPRVEIRPRRPSIYYVWVPGYWKGNPGHWTWAPGYWEHRRGQASVGKENRKVTPRDVDGQQKPAGKQERTPQHPTADRAGHQSVEKNNSKATPGDKDGQQKSAEQVRPERPSADRGRHQSLGNGKRKVTPNEEEDQQRSTPK